MHRPVEFWELNVLSIYKIDKYSDQWGIQSHEEGQI